MSIDPKVSGSLGWWVGQDGYGKVGVFPANYVQLQVAETKFNKIHQSNNNNSSEGRQFSLQDSLSSSMNETSTINHVAAQLLPVDSVDGLKVESDDDVQLSRDWKAEDSKDSLSHLDVIKTGDIIPGEVCIMYFGMFLLSLIYCIIFQ